MNREIHVPLREGLGVQFPRATRPHSALSENIYLLLDVCMSSTYSTHVSPMS
jgi:hypothetical protein